ncbi:MAG: hypothetical protein IT546_03925 [Caulobacteraceae bacterium]|nr:hypothetical protein [Caulobacteraceae bacterium]
MPPALQAAGRTQALFLAGALPARPAPPAALAEALPWVFENPKAQVP